jgi:ABC-type antimicrobial peptide transport system permease subunit
MDVKAFETKMQGMYDAHMKSIFGPINVKVEYILEPITRIHLYSTNPGEPEPTGSITYVYIFGIVAVFLVLIAAMNYMNLSTARSTRRAREVGRNNIIYVKLSGNNIQQTLSYIESKWKEVFPDQPYSYTFLSERFNRQFEADEKRGLVFTMFTILAILIASLGLFGLASYMVEQRTKEIGIRKVFGANENVIIRLISRDFIILVAISIIIAVPAAYYFMSHWLENYVYRTKIGLLLLLAAALLTIVITFITISYKAYQAAILNPANSLKTE